MRPILAGALGVVGLIPLVACTGSSGYRAKGDATPTVAGEALATTKDPGQARAAFTREDGPMIATLLDASWIRLEPDPARAEARYPEYFRGLTVVDVQLRTQAFVQPTKETYLLEDSTGVRVTAKPETYKGDTLKGFGAKHAAEFRLVFSHVLSREATWVRLTRAGAEGGVVTWDLRR